MNGELFPELLTQDHLSNCRNRGLGALIPPLDRWFLQVGAVIDLGSFIPSEPPGRGLLEINSMEPVMRVIVTAAV